MKRRDFLVGASVAASASGLTAAKLVEAKKVFAAAEASDATDEYVIGALSGVSVFVNYALMQEGRQYTLFGDRIRITEYLRPGDHIQVWHVTRRGLVHKASTTYDGPAGAALDIPLVSA